MDKNTSSALKGVAILMMIMHHHFGTPSLIKQYDISFEPFPPYLIENLRLICKICVSLFAFISGYGLFHSYKKYECKGAETGAASKWAADRYIRTMSGFWAVYIFSAIACQLINGLTYDKYFSKGILSGIFYMTVDFLGLGHFFGSFRLGGSWWYMTAAIVYIAVTPLLFDLMKKYGAAFTAAAVIVIPRLLQINKLDNANSILGFLFVFVLGMTFAKCDIVNRWISCSIFKGKVRKTAKFLTELVLLGVCYKLYLLLPDLKFWELKWGVIPAFGILFLAEFFLPIRGLNNVLAFLGKHSLNIYLVHHFVKRVYLADVVYGCGHFALVLLMTLTISLALSLIIESLKRLIRYDKLIGLIEKKIVGNS